MCASVVETYSQKDFERELEVFRQRYAFDPVATRLEEVFSSNVYILADSAILPCVHRSTDSGIYQRQTSLIHTNEIIGTLQAHVTMPLQMLETSPSTTAISEVYHRIMSFFPHLSSELDIIALRDMGARVVNITSCFFREELIALTRRALVERESSLEKAGLFALTTGVLGEKEASINAIFSLLLEPKGNFILALGAKALSRMGILTTD